MKNVLIFLLFAGCFGISLMGATMHVIVDSGNITQATATTTFTPTFSPTGSPTSTPTNTPTTTATSTVTQTPTLTQTLTPYVPLFAVVAVGSVTPVIIATPKAGFATSLQIDAENNTGTATDNFKISLNGTVISSNGIAPSGGMDAPRLYQDTNGNATWGYIPLTASGAAGVLNYRLWIAPVGTPPPWSSR